MTTRHTTGSQSAFAPVLRRVEGWMDAADSALAGRGAWIAACVLVFALQTALILNHEPWPDEYQAVQLAVQAPDLGALMEWLRYEGHPSLWYLLLRTLAYLVDPLDTLWLAALLLALPTQAMILFASPFRRVERVMIALSEFILFDFLTISRSMTLGIALLVLAMVIWRSRWVWLAIALLPFCDFLFGVLSGIFVLLKWRDKALWWPGVALWLGFSAVAGWSVLMAPDAVTAQEHIGIAPNHWVWFLKLSGLLVPFQGGIQPQWNTQLYPFAGFAWILFLILCWWETRQDWFGRLMLFGFIGLTLVFSVAVYPIGLRHLMLVAMLLILLAWRGYSQGRPASGAFRIWLFAAALSGIGTAAIVAVWPFDAARATIAEIRSRGLEDKHWMIFPDWRVPGLASLSGMTFERSEQHCMMDFVRWDHRTQLLDAGRMEAHLRAEIERHGRSYLVSDRAITLLPEDVLQPLAEIEPGYDGLQYHLYIVGPNAAERPVSLPDCVVEKRPLERLSL